MPNNRRLASVILLQDMFSAESFIPFSLDPKRQALYNAAKLGTKITSQKKHIAEALYELAWGDFDTLLKRLSYADEDELPKLLSEMVGHLAIATGASINDGNEVLQYSASAYAAAEALAGYRKKNELYEAAKKAEEKLTNLPPCLRDFLKGLTQLEDQKTISMTLRLRGPGCGGGTSKQFRMPHKPVSEKARDRIKNMFSRGSSSRTNSTGFKGLNNLGRGGAQTNLTQNLDLAPIADQSSVKTMLTIQGGAQEPVGLHFQLNEMTEPGQFEKLASLLIRNHKKILLCGIAAGMFYVFFKKRSMLKRFLRPIKKLLRHVFIIYKKVTTNRIIHNFVTRRIWIFSRSISRLNL